MRQPGNRRAEKAAVVGIEPRGRNGTGRLAPIRRREGNFPGVDARRRCRSKALSERTRRRFGSSGGSRREPEISPVQPTGGVQQCTRLTADPPARGNPDRPAAMPDREQSRRDAGNATCNGKNPATGGRARARPAAGDSGRVGVVPRYQPVHERPAGDRRGQGHRVTEPGWKGARAGRQAQEGRRAGEMDVRLHFRA